MDNQQCNDEGFRELALFAGAGGGILCGKLLGWDTVCAVEYNAYARSVLLARQNDGTLSTFPIWDDVRTFDGAPWRGIVDVVSGGFPCQDISAAGKGAGIDGERSGLWSEMARIIGEVRPRYAFVENSPMLIIRGLDRVLSDLAAMGYDAEWGIVSAADCGAPHKRERIWILATDSSCKRRNERCNNRKIGSILRNINGNAKENKPEWQGRISGAGSACADVANTKKLHGNGGSDNARNGVEQEKESKPRNDSWEENVVNTNVQRAARIESGKSALSGACGGSWWKVEPGLGRVADGVAHRVDRLKAIGNGQVSIVAATAFEELIGRL